MTMAMEKVEINVGSLVRNKRSDNIGQVMDDPRTFGMPFIKVMVLKPDKNIKYCVYWALKNLEPIKVKHENPISTKDI